MIVEMDKTFFGASHLKAYRFSSRIEGRIIMRASTAASDGGTEPEEARVLRCCPPAVTWCTCPRQGEAAREGAGQLPEGTGVHAHLLRRRAGRPAAECARPHLACPRACIPSERAQ